MNSEKISPAHAVGANIVKQAIVDRRHTLWGSEIRVTCRNNRQSVESAYSEALRHLTPRRNAVNPPMSHKFLRIDQFALMNEYLHKRIIQTAQALEKHNQRLTLSIDNPLDALPGPVERRAMVRQLYRLKDKSCITFAYNNYRLDTKPADLLIELELYDYIKMPLPDSALRLSLNTRSDLFDRLYNRMLELINATRMSFIADAVNFSDSAVLAKNLPFEYFLGGYYSPADCL